MSSRVNFHGPMNITEVFGSMIENTTKTVVYQNNVGNIRNVKYSSHVTTNVIVDKGKKRHDRTRNSERTSHRLGSRRNERAIKPPKAKTLDELVAVDTNQFDVEAAYALVAAGAVSDLPKPPTEASSSKIEEMESSDDDKFYSCESSGAESKDYSYDETDTDSEDSDDSDDDSDVDHPRRPSGSYKRTAGASLNQTPAFVSHIEDLRLNGFNPHSPQDFIDNTRRIIQAAAAAGSGQHLPSYTSKRTQHSVTVDGERVSPRNMGTHKRIYGDYHLNRAEHYEINHNCYNVENVQVEEHVDIKVIQKMQRLKARLEKESRRR
ncbi:hypothetical protein CVT24_005199 [Panaeolus cyanescens]|uniref:Uncharacterized protein n=1 Tax=Panaeolus cyanescens TaxID=181874 RepID=A0A409Y9R0_9AGAR|nr:hypothetical protein CVT24_005199 [Panaeolus cyanescens]